MCLMLLCSCNKAETTPEAPKIPSRWGYFQGNIGPKQYILENTKEISPVIYSPGALNSDSSNYVVTGICLDDFSELCIALYGRLRPGVRYLNTADYYDEGGIRLTVYADAKKEHRTPNNVTALYVPGTNPFRVEVLDVSWRDYYHPIISVRLDGILYNKDDPKDYLVIQGNYGAR